MVVMMVTMQGLLQRGHGRLRASQIARLQRGRKRGERVGDWGCGTVGLALQLRHILHDRSKILLRPGKVVGLQVTGKQVEILSHLRGAGGR